MIAKSIRSFPFAAFCHTVSCIAFNFYVFVMRKNNLFLSIDIFFQGSYKFVELLYEKGANIEMQDNDGQTPLHLITRNRHVRCLEFILRQLQPGMAEVTDNQNVSRSCLVSLPLQTSSSCPMKH